MNELKKSTTIEDPTAVVKSHMSNGTYDALKFLAQIVLPAFATLYFTTAQIWGLPAAEQIVGTIVAVDTFLGVLLGLSTNRYNNDPANLGGTLVVDSSDLDKDKVTLQLNHFLDELADLEKLVVQVRKDS